MEGGSRGGGEGRKGEENDVVFMYKMGLSSVLNNEPRLEILQKRRFRCDL